ncbi:phage regulatory CII family protein [Desulfurobacterium sp.]
MCKEAFQSVAEDLVKLAILEAHNKGYTYEMIAFKVGVSPKSVEKYASGERIPSLTGFLALVVGLKLKEPIRKFSELAGLRAVEISNSSFPTSIAKAMREAGEAFSEVTQALEDGEITEEERRACLKEINEAIDELLKLKNQLEEE